MKLSDLPEVTVDPPTHDFRLLGELIGRSQPSYVRRPLGEGLDAASRLIAGSKEVNREIYLIGDFQKSSLTGGDSSTAGAPDPRIRLFTIDIGSRPVPNAAIDSVAVLSRIFEKNRPVEISARVRNFGAVVLTDAVVSVYAGGTRVAQSNVTVEPGSAESITLTFVPRRSGLIDGSVGLEADVLERQQPVLSFTVPDRSGSGGFRAGRCEISSPRCGQGAAPMESAIEVTTATASGLSRTNLRDFDVVVLGGIASFDRATPTGSDA